MLDTIESTQPKGMRELNPSGLDSADELEAQGPDEFTEQGFGLGVEIPDTHPGFADTAETDQVGLETERTALDDLRHINPDVASAAVTAARRINRLTDQKNNGEVSTAEAAAKLIAKNGPLAIFRDSLDDLSEEEAKVAGAALESLTMGITLGADGGEAEVPEITDGLLGLSDRGPSPFPDESPLAVGSDAITMPNEEIGPAMPSKGVDISFPGDQERTLARVKLVSQTETEAAAVTARARQKKFAESVKDTIEAEDGKETLRSRFVSRFRQASRSVIRIANGGEPPVENRPSTDNISIDLTDDNGDINPDQSVNLGTDEMPELTPELIENKQSKQTLRTNLDKAQLRQLKQDKEFNDAHDRLNNGEKGVYKVDEEEYVYTEGEEDPLETGALLHSDAPDDATTAARYTQREQNTIDRQGKKYFHRNDTVRERLGRAVKPVTEAISTANTIDVAVSRKLTGFLREQSLQAITYLERAYANRQEMLAETQRRGEALSAHALAQEAADVGRSTELQPPVADAAVNTSNVRSLDGRRQASGGGDAEAAQELPEIGDEIADVIPIGQGTAAPKKELPTWYAPGKEPEQAPEPEQTPDPVPTPEQTPDPDQVPDRKKWSVPSRGPVF